MSYSFNVRARTKAEVAKKVAGELAKVVASQSVHAADHAQAQAAADSFVAVLMDDDTRDISVSMSGSVSWSDADKISSANVSVSASLVAREGE